MSLSFRDEQESYRRYLKNVKFYLKYFSLFIYLFIISNANQSDKNKNYKFCYDLYGQ